MGDAIWINKCPNHIYDFDELLVSKVPRKVCPSVYEWYFGLFQIQNKTFGIKARTQKGEKNL
jgi:hypothetical protein